MLDSLEVVGSVIADDTSPSFEAFRFKANAFQYVFPGILLGTWVNEGKSFLIGRVSQAIEINPHESAERAKVREAMDMMPDYPGEDFSTTIFRVYEAEIIEEAIIQDDGKINIEQPSNLPKAGNEVFHLSDRIVAAALGFATEHDLSLCLGTTQHSSVNSDDQRAANNVMLKREAIQRHLFIGGTTGSGKSYSTGIILEEINRLGIPIVILDSQNEYAGLATDLLGDILHPGEDYTVRLSSLTEAETLELVPTLRGTVGEGLLAYTFIRLKRNIRQRSVEGFDLQELLDGMRADAPDLQVKEPSLLLALGRTRSFVERHSFLGGKTNWQKLLSRESFNDNAPILNVDCNGLDQTQLQLIVAATLRELQTLRKDNKIPPYVVVLDEAHLLVPDGEGSSCKQVIREGVRIGRHYGICMILITQSPVDIDKKTIRQCNTRLIFALEPDQLDAIRGVRADATDEMLKRLPKMPVGTCLLSGTYETVKHAIPIRIRSDRKTTPGGATPDIFEEVRSKWRN